MSNTQNIQRLQLFGGLNSDVHPKVLPEGDYIDALNVRSEKGNKAFLENIKSNEEFAIASAPAGTNVYLGSVEDKANEKLYLFYWNSNGDHTIYRWDYNATSLADATEVYNDNDMHASGSLEFSRTSMVHGEVVEDTLIFTDGDSEIKALSITMLDAGDYDSVNTKPETITLIKMPPAPPTAAKDTTASVKNYITQSYWRFAARFLYKDGGMSTISHFSPVITPAAVHDPETTTNNTIDVTVTIPAEIRHVVDKIDYIYVKDQGRPTIFHTEDYDNSSATVEYSFRNVESGTRVVSDSDIAQRVAPIPRKTDSIAYFNKRLWMNKKLENYNDDGTYNMSVALNSTASISTLTPYCIPGASYKVGPVFFDKYFRTPGVTEVEEVEIDVTNATNSMSVAATRKEIDYSFTGNAPSWASYVGIARSKNLTKQNYMLVPCNLLFMKREQQNETDTSAGAGEVFYQGKFYKADALPTAASQYQDVYLQLPDNIPYIPEQGYVAKIYGTNFGISSTKEETVKGVVSGNLINLGPSPWDQANWSSVGDSNDAILVEFYKPRAANDIFWEVGEITAVTGGASVAGVSGTIGGEAYYVQHVANTPTVLQFDQEMETNFWSGITYNNNVTGAANLFATSCVFAETVKPYKRPVGSGNGFPTNEVPIDEIIDAAAQYGVDLNDIFDKAQEAAEEAGGSFSVPRTGLMDNAEGTSQSQQGPQFNIVRGVVAQISDTIGQVQNITGGGSLPTGFEQLGIKDITLSKDIVQDVILQPGAIANGIEFDGIHPKPKSVVVYPKNAMSLDYGRQLNDAYQVMRYNIAPKEVNRRSTISYSNPYISGSRKNGLFQFSTGNEYDIDGVRGGIVKLVGVGDANSVLLAMSEHELTSLYVGKGIIRTATDSDFLGLTSGVVGAERGLLGDYGTQHPESVVNVDGRVYFWDQSKGEVLLYNNNGIIRISNQAQMHTRFNEIADRFTSYPYAEADVGPFLIPAAYDRENDNYVITFLFDLDYDPVTYVYSQDRGRFVSRLGIPNSPTTHAWGYAQAGKSFVSFKKNTNNFYWNSEREKSLFINPEFRDGVNDWDNDGSVGADWQAGTWPISGGGSAQASGDNKTDYLRQTLAGGATFDDNYQYKIEYEIFVERGSTEVETKLELFSTVGDPDSGGSRTTIQNNIPLQNSINRGVLLWTPTNDVQDGLCLQVTGDDSTNIDVHVNKFIVYLNNVNQYMGVTGKPTEVEFAFNKDPHIIKYPELFSINANLTPDLVELFTFDDNDHLYGYTDLVKADFESQPDEIYVVQPEFEYISQIYRDHKTMGTSNYPHLTGEDIFGDYVRAKIRWDTVIDVDRVRVEFVSLFYSESEGRLFNSVDPNIRISK